MFRYLEIRLLLAAPLIRVTKCRTVLLPSASLDVVEFAEKVLLYLLSKPNTPAKREDDQRRATLKTVMRRLRE